MAPKLRINPDELLEFFSQLDSGGAGDEKCELHYGCGCVVKRGTDAARALVAIRELLGFSALDAGSGQASTASGGADAIDLTEIKADLSEAKSEIDRLLLQNMQYHKENKSLKEKAQLLQRQVERLYTKKEMSDTLKKIQEKKLTEAELALEKADGDGETEVESSEPGEGKRNLNKELAEELNIESAVPVSKEQLAKEKEEREKLASESD